MKVISDWKATKSPAERAAVAAQLRRVRGIIADILEKKNRQIQVAFTLHNRSKLPNYVLRRALLRVCRAPKECVDVPLEAESGVLMDSFSVKSVSMSSYRLDQLTDSERTFVEAGIQNDYTGFIVLQDVICALGWLTQPSLR